MTATSTDAAPRAMTARRTLFYFWMAVAMAATAFLGFAPTFWIPMAQGIPERIAVIAIHAALFFGWSLFLIYQAWLVASGKVARHRDVGMIGVSLATAMTIFGALAAINAAKRAIGRASQSLKGLGWFKITQLRGLIRDGETVEYQVTLQVGFRLLSEAELHKA